MFLMPVEERLCWEGEWTVFRGEGGGVCVIISRDVWAILDHIPAQLTPSPVNPTLHMHRKLPIVFVQCAFSSQSSMPSLHSSMSIE